MNTYIMKSAVGEAHRDALDMADLPKLGENNFHQWEEAVLAQLQDKKGNLDIPLAYVVQKPTPPSTYVDETERLVYEAKRTGPGWEQDKKTVGNNIIRLLAQSNAKTWINAHLTSQDGSAMMASLRTHFLGTAQVERIVQYACTKCDKATFQLQVIYSFEHFSTNLQEAFTLLAKYDVTIPEAEQIQLLREKIKTDKADFNAAIITSLMDSTLTTYADAAAHVSQYVSHFFPASAMSHPHGKATVSGVRLLQVAHEMHGDKYYYNGVDITDFTCHYIKDKWMKIKDLWPKIQAEKDRKKSPSSSKPSKSYKQQNKSLKRQVKSLYKRVSSQQQAPLPPLPPSQCEDQPPANDDEDEPTGPHAYGK